MSAQIQTKVLGFTLGSTTNTTIYNHFKKNNKKVIKLDDGSYQVPKVQFAGIVWDSAFFCFYKSKLCGIYFICSEDFNLKATLDVMWNDLSNRLNNKYGLYYSSSNSTPSRKEYCDDKIKLSLEYSYSQSRNVINLSYIHCPLWKQRVLSIDDEL